MSPLDVCLSRLPVGDVSIIRGYSRRNIGVVHHARSLRLRTWVKRRPSAFTRRYQYCWGARITRAVAPLDGKRI